MFQIRQNEPRTQVFYVHNATSQRIRTKTIQFPPFLEAGQADIFLSVSFGKEEREGKLYCSAMDGFFSFVFIKNVETWALCQNYFIIEGWVG